MGEGVGDGWVAELELGHFWRGPRVYVLARWAGCEAVVGQDRVLRAAFLFLHFSKKKFTEIYFWF